MTDNQSESFQSGLPGMLGHVDSAISQAEALILAVGVLLMALNTCINVVARFGFGQGLFFSGEINRILIVMITFAGIGYAARHGRHIRMSALFDMLPLIARKYLMVLIALSTALIMFALCYFSVSYIAGLYERGRILPALGFPIWSIYLWVPVGFAVTGIQYLLTAIKNLSSQEVYLSTCVKEQVQGPADGL